MKTLKVLFAVILLSVGLMAQQHQRQNQHTTVNSNNTVTNSHNITNSASGGSASAAGGNSDVSVNSGGANVSTNVPRMTPPAFAPDAYPSAPCRISASAGGSSPYFGLSFGGSKLDKDCAKRELARLLLAAGQRQAAVDVLCTTQAAKDIPYASCHQLEVGPEPVPAPIVASQPQEITVHVDPIAFAPLRFEPIAFQALPPEKPVHVIVEHHAPRKHKACPTVEK